MRLRPTFAMILVLLGSPALRGVSPSAGKNRVSTAPKGNLAPAKESSLQQAPKNQNQAAAPGAAGISGLPATEPTVLKPTAPANAIPALPSPLPAAVGARTIPAQQGAVAPMRGGGKAQPALTNAAAPNLSAPALNASGNAAQVVPSAQGPVAGVNVQNPAVPATSTTATSPVSNVRPPPPLNQPITLNLDPSALHVAGLGSSSAPWGIVVLLTTLTLIPSLLICLTPFARLLVVFHFLRQALGLQTTPSNQTLIGLALILTCFIMEPVGRELYATALLPLQNGQITAFEALARGKAPMKAFMAHYVRQKDAELFLEIAKEPRPHTVDDLSMRVMVPAYIVSELKAGFQIGTVLFLPFLVVDMVVASITTSVGMMQLPPVVISTPLKLLLFLMVDGWHLLIGALVRSFN